MSDTLFFVIPAKAGIQVEPFGHVTNVGHSLRCRQLSNAIAAIVCGAAMLFVATTCSAAPDEDALGKAQAYPAAPKLEQSRQQRYLVGSFTAMDRISPYCAMPPSAHPLALKQAATETVLHYRFGGRTLTLDDYMQRQRATGVLVLKDGQILAEHYNYARAPDMRMLSNSMAKTVVALAIGKAVEEKHIRSLDDTAATYVPEIAGTLYGETRIIDLMRMASGARFVEDYTKDDDRARFNAVARREGVARAARVITERADEEGQRFNYASAQTAMLGLVLRGATGESLCDYVDEKIWRPMGAESMATWLLNPVDRVEVAQGGLNATVRDYARLGWLMANDGTALGHEVVSRDYILDMTDASRQPPAFRPGQMIYKDSHYYGYGLQTWIFPGSHRRFALLGIYGQAIFVDPELKLVMVHTAVGKDAAGDASGTRLGAERDALWRGVVSQYGKW